MPICANEGRNGLPSGANHDCSTASQGSYHVRGMSWISHPPPPILHFLLVLASKWIAPVDNMRPKSDKRRHGWLKY